LIKGKIETKYNQIIQSVIFRNVQGTDTGNRMTSGVILGIADNQSGGSYPYQGIDYQMARGDDGGTYLGNKVQTVKLELDVWLHMRADDESINTGTAIPQYARMIVYKNKTSNKPVGEDVSIGSTNYSTNFFYDQDGQTTYPHGNIRDMSREVNTKDFCVYYDKIHKLTYPFAFLGSAGKTTSGSPAYQFASDSFLPVQPVGYNLSKHVKLNLSKHASVLNFPNIKTEPNNNQCTNHWMYYTILPCDAMGRITTETIKTQSVQVDGYVKLWFKDA